MSGPGLWLHRWRETPAARATVYAVPHAGAGAAAFRVLAEGWPEDIDFAAVRLPGRENRFAEPLPADLTETAAGLVAAIADDCPPHRSIVLMGQCSGAAFAYAAAVRLRHRFGRVALAVLSYSSDTSVYAAPEAEAALAADGFDRAVLDSPVLMGLLRPIILADIRTTSQFAWLPGELELPVLAVRGSLDARLAAAALEGWGASTRAAFEFTEVPCGHFVAAQAPAETQIAVEAFVRRHLIPGDNSEPRSIGVAVQPNR